MLFFSHTVARDNTRISEKVVDDILFLFIFSIHVCGLFITLYLSSFSHCRIRNVCGLTEKTENFQYNRARERRVHNIITPKLHNTMTVIRESGSAVGR